MAEWKQYRRMNTAEMRPVVPGEDLSKISISAPDAFLMGSDIDAFNRGFVARNPKNHDDQWYISRAYFDANFEQATGY